MPTLVTSDENSEALISLRQKIVQIRGVPRTHDVLRLDDDQTFTISGKFCRTAGLDTEHDAWRQDVLNPQVVIQALRASPVRIDLFKFWQRIPDVTPKFSYYHEWRELAVIPITSYKHWMEKQISPKARNKLRKTQKFAVAIGQSELTDELVHGIIGIFNQSQVRRGKRFWHYGKSFGTVKEEMSLDLDESIFITAHYEKELIGFIKLLFADRYALLTVILDKTKHRDKAPMNGMIGKAVEICAERQVPYLCYFMWRRAGHGDFQKANGFEKTRVPEYFVPLTLKGAIALRFGLHRGVRGLIPDRVMTWLLALRAKWFAVKAWRRGT
jgi:hypothetical protein